MKDEDIDNILNKLAGSSADVEPALLERISQSVRADLHPATSMLPSWALVICLILISGIVGICGSAVLGTNGLRVMTSSQAMIILIVLGIWMWAGATQCVAEAIPGSRRPASPLLIALSGCILLAAVFGILFQDYHTEKFIAQGFKCIIAGLGFAIPAALGIWWVLLRGFTTNAAASGFAKGMLAGLAGLTMLELHCPNLEVPHLITWHVGVLLISSLLGLLAGLLLQQRTP